MQPSTSRIPWSILFLAVILPTLPLSAQEAQDPIVITASRIPEAYRSTAGVIRVIGEEELDRASTLLEALESVPELQVVSSAPGSEYVTMGGFGEAGFARVLVLKDGIPLNRPDLQSIDWLAIPLGQIERVEVLKGSGSAQYGDQAVAGVINIITRRPAAPTITASLVLDSNFSNRQSAGISHQPGPVGFNVNVARDSLRPSRERSDADATRVSGDVWLELDSLTSSLGLFFEPSETELPGGIGEEQFEDDPDAVINRGDESRQTSYGARVTGEIDLFPLTISLPLSYRRTDGQSDFESFSSYADTYLDDIDAQIKVSQLFFLSSESVITAIGGFDYARQAITVERFSTAERDSSFFEATISRDSYATWLRGEISFWEQLFFETGVRWEIASVSGSSDDADLDDRVTHTPVAFDAGVSYLPTTETKLTLRYGRLFRYPLLDEQVSYFGFGGDEVYTDLDPETGHSITLGAEYREEHLTASVAPYLTVMADEILYDPSLFRNVNARETLHMGASLSATWKPDPLRLEAAYSWDRATFTGGETDGKVVPLVPAHTIRGAAAVEVVKGVEISSEGTFRSSYYEGGDFTNDSDRVDGRFLWDAEVAWVPLQGNRVYLSLRNILDDRTPSRVYLGSWYPEEGRRVEFGARFRY